MQEYEKIHEGVLKALPYLVRAAQSRKTVTYKEIGQVIGVHHRQVRYYAGYLRDGICIPRGIPRLNSLIVNQATGIPGDSYLEYASEATTKSEISEEFEKIRDRVFQYPGWNELLKELGLKPLERTKKELESEGYTYIDVSERNSSKGESEEHLKLKEYVEKNPQVIGLRKNSEPLVEFQFLSGDRVDVAFVHDKKKWAVVEIKLGINNGELIKGIYQAVKYRALAEAQKNKTVSAHLVAYEVAPDIYEYAKNLNVSVTQIDKVLVMG